MKVNVHRENLMNRFSHKKKKKKKKLKKHSPQGMVFVVPHGYVSEIKY